MEADRLKKLNEKSEYIKKWQKKKSIYKTNIPKFKLFVDIKDKINELEGDLDSLVEVIDTKEALQRHSSYKFLNKTKYF